MNLYRKDIDGLRALAVLLVVFFHLDLPYFKGGFVGVDVFFVISGYLITSIIYRDLTAGSFSFGGFYVRRITRLIPALLATVALSLAAATYLMTPQDLIYAAKQAVAAIFSLSNVLYWLEAGYWDPTSYNKLFLHTWSLAVEEQFYLVYPALLLVAYRIGGGRGVSLLLAVGVLAGGAAAAYMTQIDPTAAFYLTPFRMFQFAIGGAASFYVLRRFHDVSACAGLITILAITFRIDGTTPFPGIVAMILSIGAALCLLAGQAKLSAILLGNAIAVRIGRASYSIYLVHWPIVVFYRYVYGQAISLSAAAVMFAITIVLGWLLHIGVERRFRLRDLNTLSDARQPAWRVAGTATAALAICGLSSSIAFGGGWPWRVAEAIRALSERRVEDSWTDVGKYAWEHCQPWLAGECGLRVEGRTNVLILADSRGKDIFTALHSSQPELQYRMLHQAGCPPTLDENLVDAKTYPDCIPFNKQRLKIAMNLPASDIIVMAASFNPWRASPILDTAKRLAATGKRVYVIGETQYFDKETPLSVVVKFGQVSGIQQGIASALVGAPFSLDAEYGPRFNDIGATYVANGDFFRDGDGYRIFTSDGSDLLMYDQYHLTLPGAIEYGRYLAKHYPLR